jgi:hypothetical protein
MPDKIQFLETTPVIEIRRGIVFMVSRDCDTRFCCTPATLSEMVSEASKELQRWSSEARGVVPLLGGDGE